MCNYFYCANNFSPNSPPSFSHARGSNTRRCLFIHFARDDHGLIVLPKIRSPPSITLMTLLTSDEPISPDFPGETDRTGCPAQKRVKEEPGEGAPGAVTDEIIAGAPPGARGKGSREATGSSSRVALSPYKRFLSRSTLRRVHVNLPDCPGGVISPEEKPPGGCKTRNGCYPLTSRSALSFDEVRLHTIDKSDVTLLPKHCQNLGSPGRR